MKRYLAVIMILIIVGLSGCACANTDDGYDGDTDTVNAYVPDGEFGTTQSTDISGSANNNESTNSQNNNEKTDNEDNEGDYKDNTNSNSNTSAGSSSGSSSNSSSNTASGSDRNSGGSSSSDSLMMIDYCGMTVSDVARIWGSDYKVEKGLYKGGWKGVFYSDDRTGMIFYYAADAYTMNNACTGNEVIEGVEFYDGDDRGTLYLHKGAKAKSAFGELSNRTGTFFESLVDGWYSFIYDYGDYEVSYNWYDEEGTQMVYSSIRIK